MKAPTSSHILNSSSNLLGFCLVVLISLRIANYSEQSLIDEFTVVASVLLMAANILSFLAIRSDFAFHSNHKYLPHLKFRNLAPHFYETIA